MKGLFFAIELFTLKYKGSVKYYNHIIKWKGVKQYERSENQTGRCGGEDTVYCP